MVNDEPTKSSHSFFLLLLHQLLIHTHSFTQCIALCTAQLLDFFSFLFYFPPPLFCFCCFFFLDLCALTYRCVCRVFIIMANCVRRTGAIAHFCEMIHTLFLFLSISFSFFFSFSFFQFFCLSVSFYYYYCYAILLTITTASSTIIHHNLFSTSFFFS
jgi:hypothetical protein